jgi:hypothetical protein
MYSRGAVFTLIRSRLVDWWSKLDVQASFGDDIQSLETEGQAEEFSVPTNFGRLSET